MRRITDWLAARRPIIEAALTVGGAIAIGGVLLGVLPYGTPDSQFGTMGDASAYWQAARMDNPYAWVAGQAEYRYSPAFLWLIAPISWLPWPAFALVWVALHLGVLLWFRAPWLLAFPPVADDIIRGNISLFLALMVVLAFRYPGVWAFGLLTKVTPAIGVLWHLGRREWRSFLAAAAVSFAVIVVGVIADPVSWSAWLSSLGRSDVHSVNEVIPLPLRLVGSVAVLLVFRARWWVLPVGVTLAMPTLWLSSLAVLAALVPLRTAQRRSHGGTGRPGPSTP